MKIALFLMSIIGGNLLLAQHISGQDLKRTLLSVDFKHTSLKKTLKQIESISDFTFTYRTDDVETYRNITIRENHISLYNLLEIILSNTSLMYEQVGNHLIIKRKKESVSGEGGDQTGGGLNENGKDTVRGKVYNENGEILSGVTVSLANNNKAAGSKGTLTDSHGSFQIAISNRHNFLVFSYVGYQDRLVDLSKEKVNAVILRVDSVALSEVIVTALGISKESNSIGYSVTTVSGDQMNKAREVNVALSLEGLVAGLNVHGASGGPGSTARILLRGMPSMNSGGSPLFVINGVPIDNTQRGAAGEWGGSDNGDGIGNLNPDDIETMTVLKGQSASALYGSRASNGVILITTKTGKKGDLAVEYNSNFVEDKAINNTDYQYVYGQGQQGVKPGNVADAQASGRLSWGSKLDGSPVIQYDGQFYAYSAYKNNIAHFYRTAPSYTNTIAFTGGTDNSAFRLSLSDLNSQSIVRNSGLLRKTLNLTLEKKLMNKLRINVMVNYIYENSNNRPQLSDGPMNPNNGLFLANNIDEKILKPGYDTTTGRETQFSDDNYVTNPWFTVNKYINNLTRKRIISAISARYDFNEWMYFQSRVGYDLENDGVFHVTPWGTAYPTHNVPFKGQLDEQSKAQTSELNIDGLAGVSRMLADELKVNFGLGVNLRMNNHEKIGLNGGPFVLPYLYSWNNVVTYNRTYDYYQSQVHSGYYTLDLNYKHFLSLNTTGRYDAYSSLPTNNWGLFTPSVSGSFIFSELLHLPPLNYGKLRLSVAQTSGSPPLPYNTSIYYGVGNSLNGIPTGNFSTSLPNGLLKPFTLTETEMGTELRFFGSRLLFDFAWFSRRTHNEIMGASLSSSTGYTTGYTGTGSTQNKGIELEIKADVLKSQRASWNVALNLTEVRNKILQTDAYGNTQIQGTDRPNHGNAVTAYVVGLSGPQILAHDYKYDSKGNKVVDAAGLPESGSLVAMGGVLPTLYGGLKNEISFGSLNLSFLLDYNFGNKVLSATKFYTVYRGLDKMTLAGRETGIVTGVQEDGIQNTVVAGAQNYYQALATNVQSISVLNGDYIKLRQITAGYSFTGRLLSANPLFRSIRVSLVARNLLTLLKHTDNIDPEASFAANVQYAGIEGTSLPSTRSFGININFGFR